MHILTRTSHSDGMASMYRVLMDKPSIETGHYCAICHRFATNMHHIVPRSLGGKDGPTVRLCGSGTTGCHGMAESKQLHFKWCHGWEYLITDVPTGYFKALQMGGWIPIGTDDLVSP